ncbi:MAG: LysM peptidoglycan-binding domain-containing protein [Candidatus Omnitrophica bacterium]|nr:LysM peptidoglycan-binding domain-containing protein [Candidatus Omnitrophota bacterium]
MVKDFMKICSVVFVVAFLTGCASGGIRARSYVDVRERVDQNREGNQGYLMGSAPVEQKEHRKTRKVYVLEFTKELPKDQQVPSENIQPSTSTEESSYEEPYLREEPRSRIELPRFEEDETEFFQASAGSMTEYTVEKGDTLQKVSKKVYGSYSKWTKIFDANKDVLKDPNQIKPGMVLKIPQE